MKKLFFIIALAIIGLSTNAQTAYITNYGSGTVSVINVATDSVTATIPVGIYPRGVSVSKDGNWVYVGNFNSNTVSVINCNTNTVLATIAVGYQPGGVSVSPDGSKVYVANNGDNTVSVINTATNTVSATITVGNKPWGLSVSPDGSKVYVATNGDNTISVINCATNTVSATITGFNIPWGVSVSPDGSKVYVTNYSNNTVSVINSATNTVSATITVGTHPQGVCVSPDGSKAYIANINSNTVSVINTATNTVSATITVGANPIGVSVSPFGTWVYVANYGSNTVSVIDTTTNTVSATIGVGSYPYSIGNFISTHNSHAISASANPICNGASTTLTASGSTTYSWSDGLGTSNVVVVSPTTTTTYTVTGITTGDTTTTSITINVNPNPTATASGNSPCEGQTLNLTSGGGLIYNWAGPNSFSSSISNPDITGITASATGTYTVTITDGNGCTDSTSIFITVNPNPTVSISASANTICNGTSTTLTASGADTYLWSNSLGTANPVTAMPTANTTYAVTGTDINGCTGTANIMINIVTNESPVICMVTTDSATYYKYNVVCWDKTLYDNVDSFIVYRKDVISSTYLRIGAVSENSLSEFTDTAFNIGGPNGGNPQYSSWFYKLAIRDTCGNISDKSPYHQSMFVQEGGSNFSWNAYTVETGQTNPVTGYSFLRDDNNTGNWHVLVNTAGLSATDPNFASYPNGNWRIDALGFDCAPTMKLTNTQGTNLKAHSNTIKLLLVGIEQLANDEQIIVYPNPATDNITITNSSLTKDMAISVYDIQGQLLIWQPMLQPKITININTFAKGLYFVKVENGNGVAVKKFVKE